MDEKIFLVIQKLNDLRQQLDPEERKVLDLIVATGEEEEVEAHRFDLKITPKITPRITLGEDQMYKVITK